MRVKVITANERCWTHHIFKRAYKNHPPFTFLKGIEILETIHKLMIDQLMTRQRPIEIRKGIGSLELIKQTGRNVVFSIDWKKWVETKERRKKIIHYPDGTKALLIFKFAQKQRLSVYSFSLYRDYRREVHKKVLNKQI